LPRQAGGRVIAGSQVPTTLLTIFGIRTKLSARLAALYEFRPVFDRASGSPFALHRGMTHSRHAELQQMLEERRHQIEAQVRSRVRGFREASHKEVQRPRTDVGDDPAPEDIDFALVQMQSQTLENVRLALLRLAAGEYGLCAECEEEIPEQRLRALPFAGRCRTCQEDHERVEHRSRRSVQRDAGFRMGTVIGSAGT
jgi:DnaK suppressor protein